MKRSRPDLETAVSFLCTRVQFPTNEICGKLRVVLNYLKEIAHKDNGVQHFTQARDVDICITSGTLGHEGVQISLYALWSWYYLR